MSWTQLLNSCNNYINRRVFYEKLLLYFIPIFAVMIIFFNLQQESNEDKISNNEINILKTKLNNINKSINEKPNLINILKNIEKFALKNNINILKVMRNNATLEIFFKSTNENMLAFINYCESFNSYSKVRVLNIRQDKNKDNVNDKYENNVQMILSFKTFYIKKKLINLTSSSSTFRIEKKHQLNAIVGDYVLINNKWFSKNQRLDDYKITKINQNSIELKKKNKKLILELFTNELK